MEHAAVRHFRAAPPWRRIAIVLGALAAVELVVLVVGGVSLIAKPVQSSVQRAAKKEAATEVAASRAAARAAARPAARPAALAAASSAKRRATAATARKAVVAPALVGAGTPKLARSGTAVLVLNGIGTPGAAGRTAESVRAKGYRIDGVTNAPRMDYTRTMIMYKPGFRAEAARLGKDMSVPMVGPLDGMRPADLGAAQLVVIVGR